MSVSPFHFVFIAGLKLRTVKCNMKSGELELQTWLPNATPEQIADEIPEGSPRFVLYRYPSLLLRPFLSISHCYYASTATNTLTLLLPAIPIILNSLVDVTERNQAAPGDGHQADAQHADPHLLQSRHDERGPQEDVPVLQGTDPRLLQRPQGAKRRSLNC
jgi:hypothetical protein